MTTGDINEHVRAGLRLHAEGGRVSCAAALAIAREAGVDPIVVGDAANALALKITACQLGCFGRKDRKP